MVAPKPIFVSYATTSYHKDLAALEASMQRWVGSLQWYFEHVDSLGSWSANTQYKNRYIKSCLEKYGRPVVWLDADARVVKRPTTLLELPPDTDLACVRRKDALGLKLGGPGGELLSGTLYVGNTPAAHDLLDKWHDLNQKNPRRWEQRNLQQLLDDGHPAKVHLLPPSYCMIVVGGQRVKMGEPGTGVIEHYQASRKNRGKKG